MASTSIQRHFQSELAKGVRIFAGGKSAIDVKPLEPEEVTAIYSAFDKGLNHIAKVSPKLAASLAPQRESFRLWGEVAKAIIPNEKPIRYPAEAGTIGVDWLSPALHMYYAGASAGTAGQRDYCEYVDKAATLRGHDWDITFTAFTARYLVGTAAAYYYGGQDDDKHSLSIIAQNGIVEMNSVPTISQIQVVTEAQSKYSPTFMSPLATTALEEDLELYQYQTLGQIPLWHNFGTKVSVLPARAGTCTVPLLGMTFYEYDLFSSLV